MECKRFFWRLLGFELRRIEGRIDWARAWKRAAKAEREVAKMFEEDSWRYEQKAKALAKWKRDHISQQEESDEAV